MRWEIHLCRTDLIISAFLVVWYFEGCFSSVELVAEYAKAPDIYPLIVQISLDNLRRHIVKSTTEGLSFGVG